jgi:hypothetical protein
MIRVVLVGARAGDVTSSGLVLAGAERLLLTLPSSLGEGRRPAGRAARLHPRVECVQAAERKGLARSFRREIRVARGQLGAALGRRADDEATRLLARAVRAGAAAVWPEGQGAAARSPDERVISGDAPLLVVARDAAFSSAPGGEPERAVAEAVAKGRAVAFGTRRRLGAALGRPEASIVAIRHRRLAAALAGACALASCFDFRGLEDG